MKMKTTRDARKGFFKMDKVVCIRATPHTSQASNQTLQMLFNFEEFNYVRKHVIETAHMIG